jgi:hypothetical protein
MWLKRQPLNKLTNLGNFDDISLGLDNDYIRMCTGHNLYTGVTPAARRYQALKTGIGEFTGSRGGWLQIPTVPCHGKKNCRRPFADAVYAGE